MRIEWIYDYESLTRVNATFSFSFSILRKKEFQGFVLGRLLGIRKNFFYFPIKIMGFCDRMNFTSIRKKKERKDKSMIRTK